MDSAIRRRLSHRRTEVVSGQNGPSISWTDSDDGPWKILKGGRWWMAEQVDEIRP